MTPNRKSRLGGQHAADGIHLTDCHIADFYGSILFDSVFNRALPRRPAVGISLGVPVGFLLLIATSRILGFTGYVIPYGQIDFWLAELFNRI